MDIWIRWASNHGLVLVLSSEEISIPRSRFPVTCQIHQEAVCTGIGHQHCHTSPVPAEGFIVELNLLFRNLRAGKRQGLIDPETVLELMTNHMRFLLSSSCYTAKYAKIIFQRMERITFSLDGHPKQSWDLLKLQLDTLPECIRRDILLLTMARADFAKVDFLTMDAQDDH